MTEYKTDSSKDNMKKGIEEDVCCENQEIVVAVETSLCYILREYIESGKYIRKEDINYIGTYTERVIVLGSYNITNLVSDHYIIKKDNDELHIYLPSNINKIGISYSMDYDCDITYTKNACITCSTCLGWSCKGMLSLYKYNGKICPELLGGFVEDPITEAIAYAEKLIKEDNHKEIKENKQLEIDEYKQAMARRICGL